MTFYQLLSAMYLKDYLKEFNNQQNLAEFLKFSHGKQEDLQKQIKGMDGLIDSKKFAKPKRID